MSANADFRGDAKIAAAIQQNDRLRDMQGFKYAGNFHRFSIAKTTCYAAKCHRSAQKPRNTGKDGAV